MRFCTSQSCALQDVSQEALVHRSKLLKLLVITMDPHLGLRINGKHFSRGIAPC